MPTLDYFKTQALWIIMDPWVVQPYDRTLEIDINQHNRLTMDKIQVMIPHLTHLLVTCPLEHPVYDSVQHLVNADDNPQVVLKYLKKHGIRDVVFVGFHYGRCILHRYTGVKFAAQHGYQCWVYKPLCCLYPGVTWQQYDSTVSKYSKIIKSFDADGNAVFENHRLPKKNYDL
jgi:hypothetical protein